MVGGRNVCLAVDVDVVVGRMVEDVLGFDMEVGVACPDSTGRV